LRPRCSQATRIARDRALQIRSGSHDPLWIAGPPHGIHPSSTPPRVICNASRGAACAGGRAGRPIEDLLAERARTGTLLKRFPALAEVANFAAFVASDRASAMTGAIANLTCGSLVD
jgi:NAD(P)-dependent dehydrogenase (short-subunit alcohol dehydrogenase family)